MVWGRGLFNVGCRSKTQCRGMFVGRDKKMVGQVCRLGDDAFEFQSHCHHLTRKGEALIMLDTRHTHLVQTVLKVIG